MGWDSGYKSPDELDAERNAALEAQQRARMSIFEKKLLDTLGEISDSLKTIAENSAPFYEYDAASGELKVHHGVASQIHDLIAGRGLAAVTQPPAAAAGEHQTS
ncbi:hypothetical protein [Mycolicibacterium komossense]|uniref:Uncharacterized protein n=1 Tax=Mycolicibacterium komossense TaxID=1779 RepID=A0ABT3CNC5_9MYCO|nr:hypothetical protein [Mycolicibacterium komossense]MCV7230716.1 hypothetical protein [Mycolicibacterium komossense]